MHHPAPGAADRAPPADSTPPALRLTGLSKHFGGERALTGVDLDVSAGEVHGLLGQNGSGKSTLIKILAGYHAPEPGAELYLHGRRMRLPAPPGGFRDHGIAFVHQDLGLIPSLTVVENLFIGELASRPRWLISWRRERERAARLFAEYGLPIDPGAVVGDLSPVQRALLAIVRAVNDLKSATGKGGEAGLLVLDEPTPFLPENDVHQLFALVRGIVADGAGVIFVSHDVDEVIEITDRATVLRDGRVAGTLVTAEATARDFVEMIVGRQLDGQAPVHRNASQGAMDVRIDGLSGGAVDDVSIALHGGEIVGLTGLIGSGYDEIPYLVYGARPVGSGRLSLKGRALDISGLDPARAVAAGMVLIPGDRQNAGAVGSLNVADNMTIPVLHTLYNPWALNRSGMRRRTGALGAAFEVRPNAPALPFEALSGGNQQKALLAKWFQTEPALILLDEPTQGVDVGARQTVYKAIDESVRGGAAVLCASSDYEQLAAICDRVLVFSRGRVIGELTGDDVNKDTIAEHCYRSVGGVLERQEGSMRA